MKILFIGDIMGRSGREALEKHLPKLRAQHEPDIVIVNGENAAHGRGITQKICKEFYEWGTDCITTGNHVWDQREIIPYIDRDPALLRPINFPPGTVGNGAYIFRTPAGPTVKVINAMTRLFMDPIDDPFQIVRAEVDKGDADFVFIDIHGETTSEKMALAHYLDGDVTAVVGTHTHIPTADHHIMEKGTAFMSDAGMSGDYNSVIGVRKDIPVQRFVTKVPGEHMIPASGEATLCGVLIEAKSCGKATSIAPVRVGGVLSQASPA